MTIIKHRRGDSTEWSSTNPVLDDGELGFERDSGRIKIGDGVTAWDGLEYLLPESEVSTLVSNLALLKSEKGVPDGVPSLDSTGKIPSSQMVVGGGVYAPPQLSADVVLAQQASTWAPIPGMSVTFTPTRDCVGVLAGRIRAKPAVLTSGPYARWGVTPALSATSRQGSQTGIDGNAAANTDRFLTLNGYLDLSAGQQYTVTLDLFVSTTSWTVAGNNYTGMSVVLIPK